MKNQAYTHFSLLLLSILPMQGCGDDNASNPATLRDSAGIVLDWTCNEDGCDLGMRPGTFHPGGCAPDQHEAYGLFFMRFVEVCSTCADSLGWGAAPEDCRPAVCETGDDCPQVQNARYVCRHGLCQNADTARFPSNPLDEGAFLDACFAPVKRELTVDHWGATTQHVYSLADTNCSTDGTSCTLPDECWPL